MSLKNVTQGINRRSMILGYTEEYFSTLDDADKRPEKRKIKNQSSNKVNLNQINRMNYFI